MLTDNFHHGSVRCFQTRWVPPNFSVWLAWASDALFKLSTTFFMCRQSVFLPKAGSWLAGIFDKEMLHFTQFSWLISHLGLPRASRSAVKACMLLRLFSSCAPLRWHCAGFTDVVCQIACCPGEPHLPSFFFSVSYGNWNLFLGCLEYEQSCPES